MRGNNKHVYKFIQPNIEKEDKHTQFYQYWNLK